MTPETERSLLWVMEACIPFRCPLHWLLPSPDLTGLNMNMIPELEHIPLRSVIDIAVQQDLIQLQSTLLDENQIKVGWLGVESQWVDLGLTMKGGEWWEARAKPDWNAYIDSGSLGDATVELRCGVRAPLESWLRFDVLLSGMKPIRSSVRWEEESPWRPTPWKELPMCHRLEYRDEKDSSASRIPPPLWLYEWSSSRSVWYQSVQPIQSPREIWMNIMTRAGCPTEALRLPSMERPAEEEQ